MLQLEAGFMDLSSLIEALAHSTAGLPNADAEYCAAHDIQTVSVPLEFYVEPELSGPAQLAPILLVSAPAAVGKTTLARYLHNRLSERRQGVLYIPLQNANIGHDFFTGRLANVFPTLAKQEFLDAVFGGQITLLFDGYDEVTMRSDQIERNKHFVAEILQELSAFERRHGQPRSSIVFLYRSVFAEFGVFDALGDKASVISVRFFDQPRRKRYLKSYLDFKASRDSRTSLSKGHLSEGFLDGFEKVLLRAKDETAAFFGHAIVLSAFGDFLHEQEEHNAARLAESLIDEEAVETTSVSLLAHIIGNILLREVEKFPNQYYQGVVSDFEGYSVETQEALLQALAEADLLHLAGEPSYALDNAIAVILRKLEDSPQITSLDVAQRESFLADYKKELSSRISHHPFVDLRGSKTSASKLSERITFRNPVYREYYLARLIVSDENKNWDVLARVNDVSHYLALFFLHHIPGRNLSKYESFLFHLIALLATSSSGDDFLFRLTWDPSAQSWSGTVDAPYLHIEPFSFSSPALTVTLPLLGVLQNVAFLGDPSCMLEISGPGPEHAYKEPVVLRDCVIEAGEVSFAAAATRFENVTIATSCLRVAESVVALEGLDRLTIKYSAAGVVYRLSDYGEARWGKPLQDAVKGDSSSGEALFRQKLGKMLLWFRKHHRPEYGCYDKKFQTCGLNSNQDKAAMALADFLFDEEFLSRKESLIVMSQSKFSSFDIYYGKQNELQFGVKSHQLYQKLIATRFGGAFL